MSGDSNLAFLARSDAVSTGTAAAAVAPKPALDLSAIQAATEQMRRARVGEPGSSVPTATPASQRPEQVRVSAVDRTYSVSVMPKEEGLTTCIDRGAVFEGTLRLKAGALILGKVNGDVIVEQSAPRELSTILIDKDASIDGSVRGNKVVVHGKVNGTVESRTFLALAEGSEVSGEIRYSRMVMSDTAVIEGTLMKLRSDQ